MNAICFYSFYTVLLRKKDKENDCICLLHMHFSNSFNLWLAQFMDLECMDIEG